MTSPLNGEFAGILQEAMAEIYCPGIVYSRESIYDTGGDVQIIETEFDCACQVDDMTEAMRSEQGAASEDRRIIVLTNTSAPINTDAEIVSTQLGYEGVRFSIQSVASDAVFSHWILRGRRAGSN